MVSTVGFPVVRYCRKCNSGLTMSIEQCPDCGEDAIVLRIKQQREFIINAEKALEQGYTDHGCPVLRESND